ncbi:hypothetical protein BDW66DRAFT_168690 [Aspergillus desertorum]
MFDSGSLTPILACFPTSPVSVSAASPDSNGSDLWLNLSVAVALVLIGGVFAGLTIALMGQDAVHLKVLATSGDGPEQKHARTVLKLISDGKHWVLVTLLLGNVVVNESLPIVLDKTLGGGWPAVLGSTSVCVRYCLPIGAYLSPMVLALMYAFAPAAWPTARLLDYLLGENHGTVYKKAGLKTLVTLHQSLGSLPAERLTGDEVTIITAVLDLKAKPVKTIMTPMEHKTMELILSAGFSRIPIHSPGDQGDFLGMLLVKTLLTYDPDDARRVGEFMLATLPETSPDTSCLDILNYFQEGHSHMALVSESPGSNGGALGVVTLEDVVEELIGEYVFPPSPLHSTATPTPVQRHPSLPGPAPALDTRTLRRSSTAPLAKTGLINSITPEQRHQLDNLAPSNLARSPKQISFPFVKIKRAGRGTADCVGKDSGAVADENTPLLA